MRIAQVVPNDLGNLKDSMEHYLQDAADFDFVEVREQSYTVFSICPSQDTEAYRSSKSAQMQRQLHKLSLLHWSSASCVAPLCTRLPQML